MSNIEFDADSYSLKSRRILGEAQVPGVIRFLVGKKIVKNEKRAITILAVIVIISVFLTIYFLKSAVSSPEAHVIYDGF